MRAVRVTFTFDASCSEPPVYSHLFAPDVFNGGDKYLAERNLAICPITRVLLFSVGVRSSFHPIGNAHDGGAA